MNIVSWEEGTLYNIIATCGNASYYCSSERLGEKSARKGFFVGRGKILTFFSVIVVLSLLLKMFKICFGRCFFGLGSSGIRTIHQWLPLSVFNS